MKKNWENNNSKERTKEKIKRFEFEVKKMNEWIKEKAKKGKVGSKTIEEGI